MRLKRKIMSLAILFVVLVATVLPLLPSSKIYASSVSAEDRAKAMIAYYQDTEYDEDTMQSIVDGASDEMAVRLMGVFVSNWIQPGTKLDYSDANKLGEELKNIIANNIKLPENVASLYASAIAANMLRNKKGLDITNSYVMPHFYINEAFKNSDTCPDAKSYLTDTLPDGSKRAYGFVSQDGKCYKFISQTEWNKLSNKEGYFLLSQEVLEGYSIYEAYEAGDVNTNEGKGLKDIINIGSQYDKKVTSLNGILFSSYKETNTENFLGCDKSHSDCRTYTMESSQSYANYDYKTRALALPVAFMQLRVSGTNSIVWDTSKISCKFSGLLARNYLATIEKDEDRVAVLGTDSDGDDCDEDVYTSACSNSAKDGSDVRTLMIDCFGNIINSKGYMIVPACMNPYTFDESGDKVILSNSYAINYLFPTELVKEPRNYFDGEGGNTSTVIRRYPNDGCYKALITSVTKDNANINKMLAAISNADILNSKEVLLDNTFDATSSWWQKIVKDRVVSQSIMLPTGLAKWTKLKGTALASFGGSNVNSDWAKESIYDFTKCLGAFNSDTATIDLIRLGGAWDAEAKWASLVESDSATTGSDGSFKATSSVCSDLGIKINKQGVAMIDTSSATYSYGLYCTYAYILTGTTIDMQDSNSLYAVGGNISIETQDWGASANFPSVDVSTDLIKGLKDLLLNSEDEGEKLQFEVLTLVKKLLSPGENAVGYITSLIKDRLGDTMLSLHYDLIGLDLNKDSSMLMGNQTYSDKNGYVTTPKIESISYVDKVLENYDYVIIIGVLLIICITVLMVIIKAKSLQNGALSILVFSLSLFFVPVLMSFCINLSNNVSNRLVKGNFKYWVITQQQAFITDLNSAYESDNATEYLEKANSELIAFANGSSTVATVEWLCPKKDNYISQILGDIVGNGDEASNNLIQNKSIMSTIKYAATSTLSGQKYTDKNAGYVYRSYSDISMYANIIHRELSASADSYMNGGKNGYNLAGIRPSDCIKDKTKDKERFKTDSGANFEKQVSDNFDVNDESTRYLLLYASKTLGKAVSKNVKTIKGIEDKVTDMDSLGKNSYGISLDDFDKDFTLANVPEMSNSQLGLYQYLTYTESPFYYLYNSLGDKGTLDKANTTAFKTTILSNNFIENENVKNKDNKGSITDYVDFKGFFNYVLPILRQSNDLVRDFDDTYGMNVHKSIVSTQDDLEEALSNSRYKDEIKKVWKNENVKRIWNLYSPWVDVMEEASYAQPEKIRTVVDGRVVTATVEDPLNPKSYTMLKKVDGKWYGRDMVFGEADMIEHGLNYSQLTTVEKKIYKVLENCKNDMYELLNFYSFNNQVLTTSAAMSILFEFNSEFSESNLFDSSHTLYPQNFALSNFSYDGYLRLSLINATGMKLSGSEDSKTKGVYETIVKDQGVLTGILLCVNDFLAVFCITKLKIVFVIVLLLLGIISVLFSILSDFKSILKVFRDSVLIPCAKFLVVTIGHSIVASLLMGTTQYSIIQVNDASNNLNSPSALLVVLAVVHIVVTILYFKICVKMLVDLYKKVVAVVATIAGALSAVGARISGKIKSNSTSTKKIKSDNISGDITANYKHKIGRKRKANAQYRDVRRGRGKNFNSESIVEAIERGRTNVNEGSASNKYDEKIDSLKGSKRYNSLRSNIRSAKTGFMLNKRILGRFVSEDDKRNRRRVLENKSFNKNLKEGRTQSEQNRELKDKARLSRVSNKYDEKLDALKESKHYNSLRSSIRSAKTGLMLNKRIIGRFVSEEDKRNRRRVLENKSFNENLKERRAQSEQNRELKGTPQK